MGWSKEKRAAYHREYRKKNLEYMREYEAAYREENKEYIAARMREYRKTSPVYQKWLKKNRNKNRRK